MTENRDMIIKEATTKDIPDLLHFARANFIHTYSHKNAPENMERYLREFFEIAPFTRAFDHPHTSYYILKYENRIAGYYKLNIKTAQTEPDFPDSMEIERIYVSPDLKGQGLGKAMINHAKNLAITSGYDYLWLGVWEENPAAINFYSKIGFKKVGTHDFQLGDDTQTDLIMQLDLKSA